MRNKYLVVSYESDQDSFHYDVLFAETEDAARERIRKLRDYCEGFDVLEVRALEEMTARILAETESGADAWMAELEAESGQFRFRMSYRCPKDGTEWEMEWSCACNDRCPTCDAEIEPSDVQDIDEESAQRNIERNRRRGQ